MTERDDAATVIDRFLHERARAQQLTLLGSREGVWDVLLQSYWKESITVSLELGDWNLRAEAFFMRAPEDNRAETYHLFLQRNLRSGLWRFTASGEGDVMLVALLPLAAVTEAELDRLLGTLVVVTDETYVPAMKLGFERGLEEQVRRGGPGLDRPPPWAAGG